MSRKLLRNRIERCLAGSKPSVNPADAALAELDSTTATALFDAPLTAAAVLIPIVEHIVPTLLLTRRPDHLRSHPGQVSFPGGKVESGDRDLAGTALRETREETGIDASSIEIVGYLTPHAVVSGFAVTPVVGFVRPGFQLDVDPIEVAEVFEVPLEFFLDAGNAIASEREHRGVRMTMYEYHYGGHRIWGATAHIIRRFCKVI